MRWVVNATLRPLYHRERTVTYYTGRWVGPSSGVDRCGISRRPPGFDPRTVQPVASRYINWAIPVPSGYKNGSQAARLTRKYTGLFISSSGISDPCGTVAGMVTPKGSMSTEGEILQVSVLPYRCSICWLLRAPDKRFSHTLDSLGR